MAAKLYRYYQVEGGEESWTVIQANAPLDTIRPTFVTVLSLDTILPDNPDRETLDSVKYLGPMYFDLDAEDVEYSINGAKLLIVKLLELGLQATDMEIYLSGKKGLHILIPPEVFMERVQPVSKLPAIYKEVAFKVGTETVDYKVYTGRKGRMLRTCYRQRDNGLWRVPITFAELDSLTAESYAELCATPRDPIPVNPVFRPKFALVYDEAQQRISKVKRSKKTSNPQALKKDLSTVQRVLDGETQPGAGFNKIAIQVALYARDAGWSEKLLVEKAAGLLAKHESDGSRYNTPKKREIELKRMFSYVEDNPAYDYDLSGIRSLLPKAEDAASAADGGEASDDDVDLFLQGVEKRKRCYVVVTEKGELPISNFVFEDVEKLTLPGQNTLVGIKARASCHPHSFTLQPASFTSSSVLHNSVVHVGGSFTGSDTHARAIWQIMLKEAQDGVYMVDSEGVNLLKFPYHPDPEVANGKWLAWVDRSGVILPPQLEGKLTVRYSEVDKDGAVGTDLAEAQPMDEFMKVPLNKERMLKCISAYLDCNTDETIAKFLGWMCAAHWKPIFQEMYGRFPLLHVFGPAGIGKTDNITALLSMFFLNKDPAIVSPSSTPFAMITSIASSASIPVFCDEWKPHEMAQDKVNLFRGIFRDTFNCRETVRGGGTGSRSSHYTQMVRMNLSAPLIYASEAAETQTALVERSVLLSFRRVGSIQMAYSLGKFLEFQGEAKRCLPVLGRYLATQVLTEDLDAFRAQFDKQFSWASGKYLLSDADSEAYEKGEMSEEEYVTKVSTKPRMLYNSTVVLFGLGKLRAFLQRYYPEEFKDRFEERFVQLGIAAYTNSTSLMQAAVPEYQKVLAYMGQMTNMLDKDGKRKLVEGEDYNLYQVGPKLVLALVSASAYAKYRVFCRGAGYAPFYPDAIAFDSALAETPFYLRRGKGTTSIKVQTVILDYEKYQRHGGPAWFGTVRPLPN